MDTKMESTDSPTRQLGGGGARRGVTVVAVGVALFGLVVVGLATRDLGRSQLTVGEDPLDALTTTTTAPTTSTTVGQTTTTMAVATPTKATLLTNERDGLRLEVTVHTPDILTAQVLRLSVKATDRPGAVITGGADYGDGPGGGAPAPSILECKTRDTTVSGPRVEKTWEISHAYRMPGAFKLQVFAASSSCNPGDNGRTVSVQGLVSVGKGIILGNGPTEPMLDAVQINNVGDPSAALVNVSAMDVDGWIRRIELDWGDGSSSFVFEQPLVECIDPLKTWPGPSEVIKAPTHRYATPGTSFTARATVTSSACDGSEEQTMTQTLVVKAP